MSTVEKVTYQSTQTRVVLAPWAKVVGISAAVVLGTFIVFAIGFAAPELIHNAAHDIRHGLAFPCH